MAKKIKAEFIVKDKGSAQVKKAADKIKKDINGMQTASAKLTSSFKAMLGPLAAIAVATKAAFYIKGIIDYGDQLGKTSKRLGVAVGELDKLIKLGKYADITFEELNTAFRIMAKNVGMASTGTGEAARALEELGINTEELFKLDPMGRFKLFAAAISKITDASKKSEYAQMLWGRSGGQMLTLIDDLAKKMQDMNSEWTGENSDAMQKFNDNIEEMVQHFNDLAAINIGPFISDMNEILEVFTGFNKTFPNFLNYLVKAVGIVVPLSKAVSVIAEGLRDIKKIQDFFDKDDDVSDKQYGVIRGKIIMPTVDVTASPLPSDKEIQIIQNKIDKILLEGFEFRQKLIEQELKANLEKGFEETLAYKLFEEQMCQLYRDEADAKEKIKDEAAAKEKDRLEQELEDLLTHLDKSYAAEVEKANRIGELYMLDVEWREEAWAKELEAKQEHEDKIFQATQDRIDAELSAMEKAATKQQREMEHTAGLIRNNITGPFEEAILGVTSFEDAAQQMLKNIARQLMDMAMNKMIMELLSSLAGAGIGGNVSTIRGGMGGGYGFAKGGIAPGGFQAFAAGGVANKPTLGLIGEGGMNEAVVPLPDGKSIPIEGGGGDTYTINIQAIDSKSLVDTLRRNPESIIIPITEQINRGNSGLRNSLKRAVG